jgi:hypothetical protein
MRPTGKTTVPNSETNIFNKYNEAVKKCVDDLVKVGLSKDGLSKTQAIQLCRRPSSRLILLETIRGFYESMNCEGWKNSSVGSNWIWRYKAEGETESKEVLLERAVAFLDKNLWACQMSTSSGIQGKSHRRRAIDLVRRVGSRQYAFVELKVESDNPLFATFEILGYALAYLHAKANRWGGSGEHNVFDAERVELTVLGPKDWYNYSKKGTEKRFDEGLQWLHEEIAESLNDFCKENFSDTPTFAMKFREFAGDSRYLQAQNIHQGSMNW